MSTRFYFPSSGAPDVSPAFSSLWERTALAVRRKLVTPRGSSTNLASGTIDDGGLSGVVDVLYYQAVSDPISAGAVAGTFTIVVNAAEGGSAMDNYLQGLVKVVSGDGTTERGVLFSGQTLTTVSSNSADPNFEFSVLNNRTWTVTLSSVTAQAGDRLVVEWGFRTCNTGTATCNSNFRVGEFSSTELEAVNNGTGGDLDTPWCEFSQTINFGGAAPSYGWGVRAA